MYQWLLKFLNFKFLFKISKFQASIPIPPFVCLLLTTIIFFGFTQYVQLKPEIGTNFFFSSDDPQMQEEKTIQRIFPQDPQLVMSVKGDLKSEKYFEKIELLSNDLEELPQVISVQSLSHGPGSLKKARQGPLWSRIIISDDGKSSLLAVFIQDIDPEVFIPKIEAIVKKNEEPDFQILVSGEPYIIELLRRNLFEDLKKFSLIAFIVFGALFLFFFRSWRILLGTLLACANASMLTLTLSQIVGIKTGLLTANLSTIVFVLTLSHLIFIIFNWRDATKSKKKNPEYHPSIEALKMTFPASFWSMLTTLLGFLSLLLVKATPLKQLGASGAIGTFVAFLMAYTLFPFFLYDKKTKPKKVNHVKHEKKIGNFFQKRNGVFLIAFFFVTALVAMGILHLNTDPSLLAYFKKGSDLRNGLEYIDRNGGSSPMSIVIQDTQGRELSEESGYERLWDATLALESDDEVGSAVSLPVVIAQAEKNIIAKMLTVEWLIDLLETDRFGKVAKYFITDDRDKALVMLRMKEQGRASTRVEVIDRLEKVVKQHGFEAFLVGGVYSLQGRMSKLIASSLISGLSLLFCLFVLMGGLLSRSLKVAGAMFLSLITIPAMVLGVLGCLKIPLDIISAPAANIAIGMGVDAMIHLLIYVRKIHPNSMTGWDAWKDAAMHLWRPIIYTALIIGMGFGIFSLSSFPPTQRFGVMVVMGALMAPCAALIAFVNLTSFKFRKIGNESR